MDLKNENQTSALVTTPEIVKQLSLSMWTLLKKVMTATDLL